MSTLEIALTLSALLLLLAWWSLRRRSASEEEQQLDRIDTLIGWPPQATRVLTTQERVAFGTLTRALPEYMVLAQVPLARFVSVSKRNSYADWLRRLGYQCADFVICDMAAQVVGVVEVQPPQPGERARKRLGRMARTLQAAQIPLQIWTEDALPSPETARRALLPKAPPVAPPESAPPRAMPAGLPTSPVDAATTRAAKLNPFDDSARDSTHDERIELLEPPPSTWFDEFDSGLAPLQKH